MQYALLMFSRPESAQAARGPIEPEVAAVLDRPEITGWLRLFPHDSATTVRPAAGTTLLTDGPFIDSKEFLGGFIIVEADDLDGALAVAAELQAIRPLAAIEVRPVLEQSATARRWRRRSASIGDASWRPSSATSATSSWPRTSPRRRSPRRPSAGRGTASRPTRRRG